MRRRTPETAGPTVRRRMYNEQAENMGGRLAPLLWILAAEEWARPGYSALRISGPLVVMAMVCSNWAERPPSQVTTVQPSLSSRHS